MVPKKRIRHGAIAKREAWCKRCQEREASPDPRVPLVNVRHENFARLVSVGKLTNAKAYIQAGYRARSTANSPTILRRKIEVANRIAYLLEVALEQDLKTREWVDNQLKENVDRCMQKVEVFDDRGKRTGIWKYDARNAITALQLMGKDRGMFVEKLEITGIEAELQGKSAEQIIAMVEAAAVDLGRDFVKRLGEKVGLQYADSEVVDGAPSATLKPVSSLH